MKTVISLAGVVAVLALAGCSTTGEERVFNEPGERADINRGIVQDHFQNSVNAGIIRQKTVYPYHFISDTPTLNSLGARDLDVLAEHYNSNVMPTLMQAEVFHEVKVYFDYDESIIRSDAAPLLDDAKDLLTQHPNADLLITGHADLRGSDEYNDLLGAQRAESVRLYLGAHGVPEHRIRILSRGESDALGLESDEDSMQLDRHAQFMVAELQDFPIVLNVKQGSTSDQLYAARKKSIRRFLDDRGVNVDALTFRDGIPGGDGISSERVVVILTEFNASGAGGGLGGGSSEGAASESAQEVE